MNLTEREKRIFKNLLNENKIVEDDLLDAGYWEKEVKEILNDIERHTLYYNVGNEYSTKVLTIVSQILGTNWKTKYDYVESRKGGRYYLDIFLTKADFDKICDAAREKEV